ncbi:MAG: IS630 family transposase, partial [Ktedonobacteraceae bacterium]
LRAGEQMVDRVRTQLRGIARQPALIRSFFRHPSVAYISDC